MRSWRPVSRNRSRWLILFLLEWCSTPSVEARPRHRHRHRSARAERPPQHPEKSSLRSCEVWPPRSFPLVSDLYALKLEYDCRNRTIAHQRYGLASQEALQSTALAEKQDRSGIEQKNRWAEKAQSDLEARQRELDAWRDEVFRRLQAVEADGGAALKLTGRVPAEPPPLQLGATPLSQ